MNDALHLPADIRDRNAVVAVEERARDFGRLTPLLIVRPGTGFGASSLTLLSTSLTLAGATDEPLQHADSDATSDLTGVTEGVSGVAPFALQIINRDA